MKRAFQSGWQSSEVLRDQLYDDILANVRTACVPFTATFALLNRKLIVHFSTSDSNLSKLFKAQAMINIGP